MRANGNKAKGKDSSSKSGKGFGFGPNKSTQATIGGSNAGMFGYSGGNGTSASGTSSGANFGKPMDKSNEYVSPNHKPVDAGIKVVSGITQLVGNLIVPGLGSLLGAGIDYAAENDTGKGNGNNPMNSGQYRGAEGRPAELPVSEVAKSPVAVAPPVSDQAQEQEKIKEAGRVAKDRASKMRKKKKGTETILTSPLGATETAKTAITKLGGV